MRPARDWDSLEGSERARVQGEVSVGGYRIQVESDTDRVWVDLVADLPLQEWGWFVDHLAGRRPSGLAGHIQTAWDLQRVHPCESLEHVDWEVLERRVWAAARGIVRQSLRNPGEIDAFKLYMADLGRVAQSRPHHAYTLGEGGEVALVE